MANNPNPSVSFRYDTSGFWYKGNLHTHSEQSDGGKSFEELAELYVKEGYDFLGRTDHWVCSDVSTDKQTYPLLWLDGVEIEGCDHTGAGYHVVCLGSLRDLPREEGFVPCLQSARKQGALLILAHPHWSGNSLEDAVRWKFDGVEIYNHTCHFLNGKCSGLVHWETMLRQNPATLAFSVDDTHLRHENLGWKGGWIVVNTTARSQGEILSAIRRGNFYSSCGPDFLAIEFDGQDLHIKSSPVRFVRLVGPHCRGKRLGSFDGPEMTEASLPVVNDWPYSYVEIEDATGKRAWTNGLFTES
jgi:hypothetical protein